jgi:hypothetical protein
MGLLLLLCVVLCLSLTIVLRSAFLCSDDDMAPLPDLSLLCNRSAKQESAAVTASTQITTHPEDVLLRAMPQVASIQRSGNPPQGGESILAEADLDGKTRKEERGAQDSAVKSMQRQGEFLSQQAFFPKQV